ncbi:PAS domain S-box protein [Neobacillus fumarioli]|uniref:PAS domain S-box protein n=1 Tax=Neobacillus fumarioli TaxID=105229 RepID=UPI00083438A9|nr:PAS domain S-box protein [Neobacillus fumarioli]
MQKKKLILFYIIFSILWIYGSNYVIKEFVPPFIGKILISLKEFLYVVTTGCFIYYSINKSKQLHSCKEDQKRLSTLINSMIDFVTFKDGEGRWIEANEFGLKLFQLENVGYRGKKDSDLAEYSPFYADALRNCEVTDEETWKNGTITRAEEIVPMPEGPPKTFDTIKVPLFHTDGSRQGLVIIGRDITEKIQLARQLEESRQQYKSLFDYSPDIIYMLDLHGNIINLNPHFEVITGFKRDEMIGKNIATILPQKYNRHLHKFISTVTKESKPVMYELKIPDARENIMILQCTSVPIVVNGNTTGIIGYGRDVTEMRKTEERLRRTEKLSVVGELSASVAHEIRNPLTSLKGFVQLMQTDDQKHQAYYQIMLDELNRINHIVGELLLLAKPQHLKLKTAVVQNLLDDCISLLRTEARLYNVQIEAFLPDEDIVMDCEPNQLKQLFINLIKNAVEASVNGGNVMVTLEQAGTDQLLITIKDNGCGISKERLKRLGEPFYSSKEKGTGLGLTVSFKIVQAHKGTIHFETQKQIGTTVSIYFPLSQSVENIDKLPIT